MSKGLKVSKQGYNASTTGNENLSFNSDLATHAIYDIVDINKPSGTANVSYNLNLGYIPKTWIYYEQTDGTATFYSRIPRFDFDTYDIDYYVGTANITIVTAWASSASLNFRAVIFTRSPNP
jgi:hypothetical protein